MKVDRCNPEGTCSKTKMASGRMFSVDEVIEFVLDDEFGSSDDEISDEEGEDIYATLGEPVLSQPRW